MFSSVYQERTGIIDRVLKTCRDVLYVHDPDKKQEFAPSVRVLRQETLDAVGDFPSHVLHEVRIDLRGFRLPGGVDEVKCHAWS